MGAKEVCSLAGRWSLWLACVLFIVAGGTVQAESASAENTFVEITVEANNPITIGAAETDFYIGTEDSSVEVTIDAMEDFDLVKPDPDTTTFPITINAGDSEDYAVAGIAPETMDGAGTITLIKVAFTKDEEKVDWEQDGTFDSGSLLNSDSSTDNLTWTISGNPSASINSSDGVVTFSNIHKYDLETDGTYTVTATHNELSSCNDEFTLKVVAYLKVPVILKRKNISLKEGDDKYGHWWAVLDGTESYGWWPNQYVGIWDTLTSVPGILNGQPPAPYGGTATTDPHHPDDGEEEIQTYVKSHERTIDEVLQDIRDFANGYSGTWSWPFGQNCHSFQKSMVDDSELIEEEDVP